MRAPSKALDIDDTRIFDPEGTLKRYMMAYTIQEADGTYSYTCDNGAGLAGTPERHPNGGYVKGFCRPERQ